ALGLGGAAYLGAWAFGSKPLYPVALGLLAAVLLARIWTRLAGRPVAVRRRLPQAERYEGDDVQVRIQVELERSFVPATVVELERLFSEAGRFARDGSRLLLRRPAGFDLHSVREYEQGESLRKVHWRSTAKRGQLMVKELEDSPRDEVAVVLDADPAAVVGE